MLAWRSQKLSIAIVAKHVFFGGGFGMSENEVTFFPFNVTILGSKKGHFMLGHTNLLMFLLLPICVGLPQFTDSL